MVCGTGSDVGKTSIVAGLCRLLARQGVRVAPFKAQNMALNSFVTPSGHEIGRAQGIQALAAGVEPEAAMNPILLKPTGERTSQVVVMGRAVGCLDAAAYQAEKVRLWPVVQEALADLRARFDVVIVEGAGSAAEINLLAGDIVNLRLAAAAGIAAVVVGDIDRGGVFASLYGTVALLPADLRATVRGFVINKLRGDPTLLGDGPAELERRCGVPTLGVVPWVHGLDVDAEDSLGLAAGLGPASADPATMNIAVIRFPRLSNFTDADALAIEPQVEVRFVDCVADLGRPDLVILPGSKATVDDLEWLKGCGLARAIRSSQAAVLGICAGYQMMGRTITDTVESGRGYVEGLGWLEVETRFEATKLTRQRRGRALGQRVCGYQIHHGRVRAAPLLSDDEAWIHLDDTFGDTTEGAHSERLWGTTLHGLFEEDGFRTAFLTMINPDFKASGASFTAARHARIDRLADLLETHLEMGQVERLIATAAPPPMKAAAPPPIKAAAPPPIKAAAPAPMKAAAPAPIAQVAHSRASQGHRETFS